MNSTAIDLSRLAAPELVETINFETLLDERKARLIALTPPEKQAEVAATLELESEPLVLLLQENAYREMYLIQKINDTARGVMLAYARGNTLEHLGALMGVERLTIRPADPLTGSPAVMEEDTDLRTRILLAPEGFSVAGPVGAYIAAAMNADGLVLDAAAKSPAPGAVLVSILSRDGNGTADDELVAAVEDKVNDEAVRPLTDQVTVQSAEILEYQVTATLFTFPGPDSEVVMAEARKRLSDYLAACHRIGREVAISGIHAALHVAGIERVELTSPAASVQTNDTQAPYCTAVSLTHGGIHA